MQTISFHRTALTILFTRVSCTAPTLLRNLALPRYSSSQCGIVSEGRNRFQRGRPFDNTR